MTTHEIVDDWPEGATGWAPGWGPECAIASKLEAWIRHGEAVPADVTTYDREIVHAELRQLINSADLSEQAAAASLSDEAMLAELVKRGRLKVHVTEAEKIVERFDAKTQREHRAGIAAARLRRKARDV